MFTAQPAVSQDTHGKKIETRKVPEKKDNTEQSKLETRSRVKKKKTRSKELNTIVVGKPAPISVEKLQTHEPKGVNAPVDPNWTLTIKKSKKNKGANQDQSKIENRYPKGTGVNVDPNSTLTIKRSKNNKSKGQDQSKLENRTPRGVAANIDPNNTLTIKKSKKNTRTDPNSGKLLTTDPKTVSGSYTDGSQLYSSPQRTISSVNYDERKMMTRSVKNRKKINTDDSKLMNRIVKDYKKGKVDDDVLLTRTVSKKKKSGWDNEKLMTHTAKDRKKSSLDSEQLMTHNRKDRKKAYWDDNKTLTLKIEKGHKFKYDPNKESKHVVYVYTPWDKVSKTKPYNDTKPLGHRQIPFDTRIAKKGPVLVKARRSHVPIISDKVYYAITPQFVHQTALVKTTKSVKNFEGDYKIKARKHDDMHPSARHMKSHSGEAHWKRNTKKWWSVSWSRLQRRNDVQPAYVKQKKRKPKYDKREREIWQEDTRHPRKKEERAEID